MAHEDTPLLPSENDDRLDDIYLRFSSSRKNIILAIVSMCGVINYCLAESFTPSIPQIAKDLNSTGTVVNIAVSMTVLASPLGGLIASSYSTFYGRRPAYLCSLPILVIGSAGVATAQNIPSLLFWKVLQSMGAAPGLFLSAGVIGDIYKLEERGRAIGVFFAVCFLGTTIAPFFGGWTTEYYSWRVVQGTLGLVGLIAFITIYFLLPETSQPGARGIDKMIAANEINSSRPFIFINPLEALWLFRSPVMLSTSIVLTAAMISMLVLVIPLAYILRIRYHITNDAIIGACFLPAGLGSIVGAAIIGRISDYTVIKWRKKRNGVWYPEDRLRAALIPFAVLVPLSLIAFGLVNKYVDGTLGVVLSLVCLFLTGVGSEMCVGPVAAYLVDVLHSRSAEGLAANSLLRGILAAMAVAATLPMIDAYGIVVTNALCAVLVWLSFIVLCYIIKYGDQMRAWVDVGFSTAENN